MKTLKFLSFLIVFGITSVYGQITWQKQNGPYGGSVTDMAYHSSGKVFAIISYSLFVSADAGATWTIKDVGQNFNQLIDIEIDGSGNIYIITSQNLFVSTDGGTTFIKKNSGSTFTGGLKVKKNPLTGTIYVLGYNTGNFKGQIYKSTDAGVTWSTGYNFTVFGVTDIAVSADGYVFSAEGFSSTTFIERSNDDGATFSPIITGITETSIASLAVNAAGTKVYCTTSTKIYESDPATIAWTAITGAITGGTISGGPGPSYLAFTPDGSKRFFIDNNNHKFYTQVVTPSLGAWTATVPSNFIANSGVNSNQVPAIAVKDANNIFFGTDGMGVIKTVNGGGVVSEANTGIEGYAYRDFVIASNGNIIVATSNYNGTSNIFTSVDGGQTFSRKLLLNGTFSIYNLFKVAGSTILAFGNVAYKSTDSGVTWSTTGIVPPPSTCYQYQSPDGVKIIGLSGSSFYFSANSGGVWNASPITISGLPGTYNIYSFTIDQLMRCVTTGYNSGSGSNESWSISFNSTTNPTTGTATKITTMTNINSNQSAPVSFGNNIYVMGYNQGTNKYYVDATADGGATWASNQISNGGYKIMVDDLNGYLFVGNSQSTSQIIYISRDGGVTFPTTTTILNTSNKGSLEAIKVDASGKAYAFVDYMSLFKTPSTIITPATPSLLTEVGHATDRISIRWQDNSTTETYFQVDRFNGSSYDSIGRVSQGYNSLQKMYFEDKGLQPNTAYTYRVSALNAAGYSSYITTSALTTLAVTAPSIPDNRSWTGSTTNANSLGGPYPNYSAAISILQIGSTGHYSVSDVTGVSLSTITGNIADANLASEFYESSGKTYFEPTTYKLKPQVNGTWNGSSTITLSWRADATVTLFPDKYETINLVLNANDPTPAAPTNLAAYVYTNTSIEVKWTASSFDKTYTVERSLSPTFASGITVLTTSVNYPTTTYLDNGTFTAATTYYYRVKSTNGNAIPGVSLYSAIVPVVYGKPNFVVSNTLVSNAVGFNSGAIWGDFNNDGFDDLIIPQLTIFGQTTAQPFVFKNDGAGNFTAVANSNLDIASYLTGTAGDYNNDGKLDVFFTNLGAQSFLFAGNGDMTFTKVDPTAVQEMDVSNLNSIYLGSTWGDYDKDGILDLFVGIDDNAYASLLFKGNSDGSFTKIVAGPVVTDQGFTTGASWVDIDNDGDLDLFILDQDSSLPSRLYINNGSGTFTLSTAFAADVGMKGFSASWGDYNNDEFLDLFIGTQNTTNVLYKNNGNGTFTKVTASIVMTDAKASNSQTFGSAWGDVNNDGYLDLMVSNSLDNQFYINNANPPNNTFTKVLYEKFCAPLGTFGMALADYDHDGFLDAAVAALDFNAVKNGGGSNSKSYLFKNNNTTGAYYEIKLKGTISNRSAIGTRIRLTAGGKTQVREIASSTGFGAENSLTAHFGLGANTTITSLQIKWPSGIVQNMSNITSLNQIITIIEDNTGPVTSALSPANAATNVNANTTLSITLNETSTAVATKTVKLFKTSDLVTPVESFDASIAAVNGNVFTFTPAQNLLTSTSYSVSVDAGAFKDIYGNPSLAMSTSAWQFTSAAGPVASALSPANAATNVNANTTLSITLSAASTAVATKMLTLFTTANLNPVASILVTSAAVIGNVFTFTLPLKLLPSTSYSVSVDVGAFMDANGNLSGAIGTSSWHFTSAAGPVVSLLNPLNSAVNVAVNTPVEITFSAAPTPVAGKKISVFIQGSGSPEFSLDVTTGTLSGNKISFTPPAPLGFLNIYDVVVDAGAFTDQNGNATLAITWSFVTIDNVPPVITFTPPSPMNKGAVSATLFSATVTDNSGTVSSATLSYRPIAGGAFTDLPGVFNSTSLNWDFAVTETMPDGNGLEYFITAKDPANNQGRLPLDLNTNFYIYLSYPAAQSIIPSSVLGLGGQAANWKIFTIPFELGSNNGISSVLDELGTDIDDKTKVRMLTYVNDVAWGEFPGAFSTFTRGKGYFINIKTAPGTLTIGDEIAPSNNRKTLFQLSLKKGWNEIGNPYLTPISWPDVSTYNGLTGQAQKLLTFASGSYSPGTGTILQKFEGGFVFVDNDVTITIPFSGQTSIGGRTESVVSSDIGQDGWLVNMSMQQDGLTNAFSAIGMQPSASLSKDEFDEVNPPKFFQYLEMDFPHPEHFAKNFSVDVVPTQPKYTWEFTVESNQAGIAELSWDNSALGNGDKELYLFDIAQQKPVDMRQVNKYRFNPRESGRFRIYFGQNLEKTIKPDRIMLGEAFPNPSNGVTTIPFTLPEQGSGYPVRLEVYDMMGNKVATPVDGELKSGFYSAQWNSAGSNSSDGIYIYRLIVGNQKDGIQSRKVVLRK